MPRNHSVGRQIVRRINADPALRNAIVAACAEAGEPLTKQAVIDWKKLAKGVPLARVPVVARVLNMAMHEIRPDVFPAS